jgi:DNA-binding transcriptional ArsR family regulator
MMPLVQALKALADQKRLIILKLLVNSDLCVGALASRLGVSKPAVSQHLKVLRQAGLVRGEKRGYWTHYAVDRTELARIAAEINALAATDIFQSIICRRIDPAPVDNPNLKEDDMCQSCCQQPDKLKDKPENCSPQQIRECHGDVKEHPCAQEKRDPEQH